MANPDFVMTEHFKYRWRQRVGGDPRPAAVNSIINDSVIVQPCMNLFRPDGRLYRVCAIYWHPGLDLIVKVDECRNCAVAILSRDNWRGGRK